MKAVVSALTYECSRNGVGKHREENGMFFFGISIFFSLYNTLNPPYSQTLMTVFAITCGGCLMPTRQETNIQCLRTIRRPY